MPCCGFMTCCETSSLIIVENTAIIGNHKTHMDGPLTHPPSLGDFLTKTKNSIQYDGKWIVKYIK